MLNTQTHFLKNHQAIFNPMIFIPYPDKMPEIRANRVIIVLLPIRGKDYASSESHQ